MGWYATLPGGIEYKYGDAAGLANACRLGILSVTPRLAAIDEGGDRVEEEDIEFMGSLQARIKHLGLPWSPDIEFDKKFNESVAVDLDATPQTLLKRFGEQISSNRDSVLKAIAQTVDGAPEIVELGVSIELDWSLPESDQQKLVDWLTAKLGDDTGKISLEGLRRGTRDEDDWYQPPDDLEDAFEQLKADDARLLAAHALAQALLGEGQVSVGSPDDDFQLTVWNRDGIAEEDSDDEDDEDED